LETQILLLKVGCENKLLDLVYISMTTYTFDSNLAKNFLI